MQIQASHCIITGAAHGIGRALAKALASRGARALVLVDRDGDAAATLASELQNSELEAHAVTADVTDESQIRGLVEQALERSGPIDLCCSNAGIGVWGGVEASDADWDRSYRVHVMAHVYAARAVLPSMLERKQGHLLQTASAAGLLTQIGSAPYAVTKHASVALAEWLAIEYADRGIGVSVLCPQAVRTAMTEGLAGGGVAGVDGMLEADAVAEFTLAGLEAGDFWILPHPEVRGYVERKATDIDRWLTGMRRLRARFHGLPGLPD